jgi:hypothetical protein
MEAQRLCDDLRKEILLMAVTIEAQEKRIGELEAVAATCSPYVRGVLYAFYTAPISMSSVQPVLDLAVALNPSLKEGKL